MTANQTAGAKAGAPGIPGKNMAMLVVLYASAFLAAFNENVVNTALVGIMGDMGVGSGTAQWLVTGYMVVTATMVTLMGWAYHRFGTKQLFVFAALVFGIGEVGALVAPTFPLLLAARLVQAIGTGVFIPTMMSSVLLLAPRERIGTFLSIGTCMITFGPAFAPVVSGAMATAFGWRHVFVPPLVAVVVLLVFGLFLVRAVGEREKSRADVLSIVLSAGALTAFSFGLSQVSTSLAWAAAGIALGIAVGALFAWRQFRLERPLLDLSPLQGARFWPACLLTMVGMMTTFSMSVLLPLYFEGSLGTTAFVAGCLLLVPILVNSLLTLIAGRIMDTRGEWPLLPVGFALIVVGQACVALLGGSMSLLGVLLASIVTYSGVACVMSPSQTAGLKTLSPAQHADGVAIVNTFVQVAACIGPSLFVGVLSGVEASETAAGATAAQACAQGFSDAVWVAAIIALLGLALSFLYARKAKGAKKAAEGK